MKQKKVCAICGKTITAKSFDAELSTENNEYYAEGVPKSHASQGWFDIGAGCFKKHVIKETPRPSGPSYYERERNLW
jgi:hypothetical protein